MKTIHVLRKPCSEETVSFNVLVYGTGAIYVDATRISTAENLGGGAYSGTPRPGSAMGCDGIVGGKGSFLEGGATRLSPSEYKQPSGRWPANLVLQHLDGCVQEGVKKVPGHKGYPNGPKGKSTHYSSDARSVEVRPNPWAGHADPDGTETIPAWTCAPGCPVAGLDAQSGDRKAGGGKNATIRLDGDVYGHGNAVRSTVAYFDAGSASRFFKQVK